MKFPRNAIFVYPHFRTSGGNKILSTYAHTLAAAGWQVTAASARRRFTRYGGFGQLADYILRVKENLTRRNVLNIGIRTLWWRDLKEAQLSRYDLIVVSFWRHAVELKQFESLAKRVIYLCQGDESLFHASGLEELAKSSYVNPFMNLAVSSWVAERVAQHGGNARVLVNPIGDTFHANVPRLEERPMRVGILVHPADFKRSRLAAEVANEVKARIPQIEVVGFGAHGDCGLKLDHFVDHPDELGVFQFLSQCRVFLSCSVFEGFGLPAAEAMASGAVLVSTSNGGLSDFAFHESSALISESASVGELVRLVCAAFENPKLAQDIADQGRNAVSSLTIERKTREFSQIADDLVGRTRAR